MAGTRWVRLDTSYLLNPKILQVDHRGVLLHIASIGWCAEQLTDGQVPTSALAVLATMARLRPGEAVRASDQLVDAGLWHKNGDGWEVHDFVAMNAQVSREQVLEQRAKWSAAKTAQRNRKR